MERELILSALRIAGLSEDLADGITVENATELEAKIKELKAANRTSFADFINENGYESELNELVTARMTPEIDRRVTQALKTFEDKMNKGTGGSGGTGQTAVEKQLDELKATIATLTDGLTGQKQFQEQQQLRDVATVKLEEAGLPKSWLGRINVSKEDEIDGAVTALKEEFAGIRQTVIDEQVSSSPFPGFGNRTGGQVTHKNIDEFAKTLETEEAGQNVHKLEPDV